MRPTLSVTMEDIDLLMEKLDRTVAASEACLTISRVPTGEGG